MLRDVLPEGQRRQGISHELPLAVAFMSTPMGVNLLHKQATQPKDSKQACPEVPKLLAKALKCATENS